MLADYKWTKSCYASVQKISNDGEGGTIGKAAKTVAGYIATGVVAIAETAVNLVKVFAGAAALYEVMRNPQIR